MQLVRRSRPARRDRRRRREHRAAPPTRRRGRRRRCPPRRPAGVPPVPRAGRRVPRLRPPDPGQHTEPFAEVARRRGAWILVGSVAETSSDPDRPYNTSVLIAPGRRDRRDLPQDPPLRRRGRRRAGRHRIGAGDARATGRSSPTSMASPLGLTICYDLRFPELYRALALAGRRGPDRPGQFHGADRPRPLGGPAPGAGDRERRLGARAVADRRAARPAGLRPVDGHRPVGHGRRPGAGRGRDRPRRHRHGPRRRGPAPDPRPGQPPARRLPTA